MARLLPAVALALLLSACASTPPAAPPVTVTAAASPAVGFPATGAGSDGGTFADAQFVQMVKDGTDYFDKVSDADIMKVSKSLCAAYTGRVPGSDPLATWGKLLKSSIANGMDAKEAGAFITLAVAQYCSEDYDTLPQP